MPSVSTFRLNDQLYAVWSEAAPPLRAPPVLTEAERKVLKLVLEGHSNAHIARVRGTATRTVANQIASLFRKHDVHSRAELVASLTPS